MPKLLRSSDTMVGLGADWKPTLAVVLRGCGATIELDSTEVVYVAMAKGRVLVRFWDMKGGFIKSTINNFSGPKLYDESNAYKNTRTARALRMMFPEQAAPLQFKNPVLAVFSNAIWHCASAAEVCTVLNEAAAKKLLDSEAELQEAAKDWPPRWPLTVKYRVVFSHGKTRDIGFDAGEMEEWVAKHEGPYRIVRILDANGKIVWGK
jgi:hypothetical protein